VKNSAVIRAGDATASFSKFLQTGYIWENLVRFGQNLGEIKEYLGQIEMKFGQKD